MLYKISQIFREGRGSRTEKHVLVFPQVFALLLSTSFGAVTENCCWKGKDLPPPAPSATNHRIQPTVLWMLFSCSPLTPAIIGLWFYQALVLDAPPAQWWCWKFPALLSLFTPPNKLVFMNLEPGNLNRTIAASRITIEELFPEASSYLQCPVMMTHILKSFSWSWTVKE